MPHAFPISDGQRRQRALDAVLSAPDGYVATFQRVIHLKDETLRGRAVEYVRKIGAGWVLRLTAPNRTKEQNDKMWPMLTDISNAKPMGRVHNPEQWKAIMMRACGHELGYLNDLNGEPFPIGYRSSKMTVKQMIDLITFIEAFGAEHGVEFKEPNTRNKAA